MSAVLLQRRLSITCTGSGKSVVGPPAPRVLCRDVPESAEAAGKSKPAEEEQDSKSAPESAEQAGRGFKITVDKVGRAPSPRRSKTRRAKSQRGARLNGCSGLHVKNTERRRQQRGQGPQAGPNPILRSSHT